MKLKKLTINNIASISKGEIDFTKSPLSDAPIFLICGETGSGKTTILDAICLALYDRTPRLSNKRATTETQFVDNGQNIDIKNVVQLLKKGETAGNICLLFEGNDGNTYQADWSCKMGPRTHKIDDEVWTITDASGNQKKASEDIMKEITGMDFDQFCRTSMLAQGEFTAFLKAGNDKKSEILEKITGTEIYAKIGKLIHDRYLTSNREYETARAVVGNIEPLPPEEAEKLAADIEEIKKAVKENDEIIIQLESLIGAYESIETGIRDKDTAIKKRDGLKDDFRNLCAGLVYDKEALEKMKKDKASLDDSISKREKYAPMYEKAQAIASELQNVSRQEKIESEKKAAKIDAEKAHESLKDAQVKLISTRDEAKKEFDLKSENHKKAKEVKEGLGPEAVENERKAIVEAKGKLASARVDWAKIDTDSKRLLSDAETAMTIAKEVEEDKTALEELIRVAEEAKGKYEVADKMYQKQKECTEKFVTDLRERLKELGAEECPVCHSRISKLTTPEEEEDNLRPVRAEWTRLKGEWEKAEDKRRKAEIALGVKKVNAVKADEGVEKLKEAIVSARAEFSKKYASMLGADLTDIEAAISSAEATLDGRSQANEENIGKIRAQDQIIAKLDKEAKSYEKDTLEPARKAVEEGEKAIIAADGEVKKADQGIRDAQKARKDSFDMVSDIILYPDWESIWSADREAFEKRLRDEAKAYDNDQKEQGRKATEIETLKGAVKIAEEVMKGIAEGNDDFEAEGVIAEKFNGNAAVSWGILKQGVEGCNEAKAQAEKSIAENQAILDKAAEADGESPMSKDELITKKGNITADNTEKNTRKGAFEQKLKDNEELKIKKEKLTAERDARKVINDKWQKLNKLFGGEDGVAFKKVAQSYIMQDILNQANGYLRKIAPRYQLLAQPGSLIILVRDTDDQIIRSGNTLSGGEGFVVSLALALGLSSLAESSISTDTIFIDEGFGTLSHDWLNNVMNTLEKLNSTSGKHIGMITHMEELQKKIPTFIKVERIDASSSTISVNP